MKNIARILIPTGILAILLLTTGGLAFAKEFGFLSNARSEIAFSGLVEAVSADSMTVNGTDVALTTNTELGSDITVGTMVRILARRGAEGTLTAHEVALINRAGNSRSDTPTLSSSEVEIVGNVDSISSEAWVISGQAFAITTSTEIKGTIMIGDQVKVHAYTSSTGVLTAREIELFTGDDHDDDDGEVEFSGAVESIGIDTWIIGGQTILVTLDTELDGSIVIGDMVKVEARVNSDGTLTATEIDLFDDDDDQDGEDDDDDFSDDADDDDDFGDDDDDDGEDDRDGGDDDGGDRDD